LGDVVVVVTRYFGGTKLGTGGLVRAYGDAVREVLKHVPVAEKVRASLFCMTIPYSLYERVEHLASKLGAEITEESFGAQVDLEMRVRSSRATELRRSLAQLSAGEVEPELIEEGLALVAVSGAGSWEEGWRAEGGSGG
jgi:putative IMPACT (imprinted ancient) family translation regulator